MTITAKVLLAYLVAALVVFAWMFRYDVRPGAQGLSYLTDRWTGIVRYCIYEQCKVIPSN